MPRPGPSSERSPTPRTRVLRHPERARYDRGTVDAILREGLVCHVAFVADGTPRVLPTTYAPFEGGIVVHGGAASRMYEILAAGAPACICVTLLDGLVLARSAFHHSMNYRSVVLFGAGVELTERERKRVALAALVEHVVPGRNETVRQPTDAELDGTRVVWFAADEASAKVRTGPPIDAGADAGFPAWAGTIPFRVVAGPPEPDAGASGLAVPEHVASWTRGG